LISLFRYISTKIIFKKSTNYFSMKNLKTLLFFLLLLLGLNINAQKVDLSLRFNAKTTSYEVYARPDFTKGEFLIGASSQVTVLIPADVDDNSLEVSDLSTGNWIDQQPVLQPKEFPERDLHTFISQGGTINFEAGVSVLLFSFQLPFEFDHKSVRLFVNKKDPALARYSQGKNLGNFIANDISLTDFYQKNYEVAKDITGTIKDWRGYPIEGVHLTVGNQTFQSLYDGRFEFYNTLVADATSFNFQKAISSQAGISIADVIRLQQHLSGEAPFDQPYQWIAADLDNSGTITYQDVTLLKQLINGDFEDAGWRIVPLSYFNRLPKYQVPLPPITKVIKIERVVTVDFVGVKLGDVNGSYTVKENIANNILPSAKSLTINLLNAELKAGENYIIPFSTNGFLELTAYQLTLKIEDAAITQLENTFKKQPGLSLKQLPEDLIIANWLNDKLGKGITVSNKESTESHQSETSILELEIIPKKDGLLSDFITLMDMPVKTEAYDKSGKMMPLQLLFRTAPAEEGVLEVYQNQPNPFREFTNINYFLPKTGATKLTLTDESGQIIKVFNGNGQKGFNSFTIQGNEMPKGLIYYKLETDFGEVTKKMLHLN